jgi:hypothetical protein
MLHKQLVTNCMLPKSPLQATASLSRTYSISWIEAFIIFIDATYDELTQAKFSSVRGWSLITRLAYRILIEFLILETGSSKHLQLEEMT